MEKKVGMWLDHRHAQVVILSNGSTQFIEINSGVEKRPRFWTRLNLKVPDKRQAVFAEDIINRQYQHQFNHFFDQVIAQVKDAKSVLLIGPGEAKHEFQSYLQSHKMAHLLTEVQTVDKMSQKQIIRKVRDYFNT
jgi:hypothetical protein